MLDVLAGRLGQGGLKLLPLVLAERNRAADLSNSVLAPLSGQRYQRVDDLSQLPGTPLFDDEVEQAHRMSVCLLAEEVSQ
jgi:hypothetical protein